MHANFYSCTTNLCTSKYSSLCKYCWWFSQGVSLIIEGDWFFWSRYVVRMLRGYLIILVTYCLMIDGKDVIWFDPQASNIMTKISWVF